MGDYLVKKCDKNRSAKKIDLCNVNMVIKILVKFHCRQSNKFDCTMADNVILPDNEVESYESTNVA